MVNITILIFSFIGFLISLYAFHIEKKLEKNKKYAPACDIHKKVSCKLNLSSKYSKVFKISNSLIGIIFYIIILILSIYNLSNYIFYLSLPSLIFSLYLASISFFKLKNFCLVCTPIYLINIIITLLSSSLI